jgi:hypothetical protein
MLWMPSFGVEGRPCGSRSTEGGGVGVVHYGLQQGERHVEGIVHYVRIRAASAGKQPAARPAAGSTSGTGGLTFPAVMARPLAVR